MSEHGPARWSGSGKKSVRVGGAAKEQEQPEQTVAAPETGSEITLDVPTATEETRSAETAVESTTVEGKAAFSAKGRSKTGG